MEKNNFWQSLRGVCIVLVILIHTLYFTEISQYNYTNIFIRRVINFATALFIFMAGYFTNIRDTKDFYKKKFFRIAVPLIIWDIIYGVIELVKNNVSLKSAVKMFLFSSSIGHLYYLYVLLQLFLVAPLLLKYLKKYENNLLKYVPLFVSPLFCLFLSIYQIILNRAFPFYNYWIFGWLSYY